MGLSVILENAHTTLLPAEHYKPWSACFVSIYFTLACILPLPKWLHFATVGWPVGQKNYA